MTEHSGDQFYCAQCAEYFSHQHKPTKPTYDELVLKLRDIEHEMAQYYAAGGMLKSRPLAREEWVDLRNLLARVDNGRVPPEPTYETLVEILKKVRNDYRECGSICKGTADAVSRLMERVRTGR